MKIIKITGYLWMLLAILTACQEPMEEITDTNYPLAFSPISLTVALGTYDKATVDWKTVDNAKTYIIELSRGDSLQFNNVVATYETEAKNYTLTGLWGETRYSVRVKANPFNESQSESKWSAVTFRTNAEQIFNTTFGSTDIRTDKITLRWTPNAAVTKLNVSPEIGDVVISAEEKAAGVKTLTGLKPSTQYTISIYNNEQKRGTVTPTTKWRPFGDGVIDVPIGGDLGAICENAANIGKIIYLPEGFTYDVSVVSGIVIAGKMTIYGDPDAEVKPTITLSNTSGGARLFQLPASADEILFTNLTLVGPGAGAGTSVLDQDLAKAAEAITNLKAIKFENCDMSDFGRSLIRLRTAAGSNVIKLVSMNNCVCKNFGNNGGDNGSYAFFTLNTASSGIDSIKVTNSTFQTQYHSFVNAPTTAPNTSPAKFVVIENCTFNDIITGPTGSTPRYFIDASNNPELTVTIKNVIFGKSGTGDPLTTKSAQYRIGTGSTITVTGSYRTSDHSTAPATADFTGVTSYSRASTDLWNNPTSGNFTFKDTGFAGKATAGDPRWW